MGRLQINTEGITARPNSSWGITAQFATAADITSVGAMTSLLTTAFATLAGSASFKASVGSNFTIQRLHGLYYPTPGGTASIVGDSTGSPFVGTGSPGVPSLAVVVSERTAAAGPSNRGRTYWPWHGLVNAADGVVNSTNQGIIRTGWRAWHDAMIAAGTGAGLTPVHVVFSRKTLNMTPISGYCTGNRVDNRRTRMGKDRETYLCDTVPAALTIAPLAPVEPELAPSSLGPEAEAALLADPDFSQAVLDSWNSFKKGDHTPDLGDLKQAWETVQTILELRSGA